MFLVYCNDGEREYYGKHYVHPHMRKSWEFQFLVKGKCTRLIRSENVTRAETLAAPAIVVSGPDSVHGWSAKEGEKCSILTFHFDEADYTLRQVVGREGSRSARVPARELSQVRALYVRCQKAKLERGAASFLTYNIVALELTAFFLRLVPSSDAACGTDFGAQKVIEALAWYEANLALGPTINEVAQAVNLSPTHLRRLFHRARGMSPQDAFSNVQFERAKELMLDPSVSLEGIAESSGFGSASAFSRAFKGEFGSSPKIYRIKLLREHRAFPPLYVNGSRTLLVPELFCPTAPEAIVENVK